MKKITILGSTGSIGTQTLDVVERSGSFQVLGITANSNVELLETQIRKFKPEKAAIADPAFYHILKTKVADTNTQILSGREGVLEVAGIKCDITVSALVGIAGLLPTLRAIETGNDIALANKETLVTGGELVMTKAKEKGVKILPVDSEHSAVFQCLNNSEGQVKKIILTASGGPFLGKTTKELSDVTPEKALKHPNWSMGSKVTIDSATLMNKGLEIMEAKWLFDMEAHRVDAIVHPQSIIHSMVEFKDGAILAQLGEADMRLPISYALHYPERECVPGESFDFLKHNNLTFQRADEDTFCCLYLAKSALRQGGTMPACLNGANEVAVDKFLSGRISFLEIPQLIEEVMKAHKPTAVSSLEVILETDKKARALAEEFAK